MNRRRHPLRRLRLLMALGVATGIAAQAESITPEPVASPLAARFTEDLPRPPGPGWTPAILYPAPAHLAPPDTTTATPSALETAGAWRQNVSRPAEGIPNVAHVETPRTLRTRDAEEDDPASHLGTRRRGWLAATVTRMEDSRMNIEASEAEAWDQRLEDEEDGRLGESTGWRDAAQRLDEERTRVSVFGVGGNTVADPDPAEGDPTGSTWFDFGGDTTREVEDNTARPALSLPDYNR